MQEKINVLKEDPIKELIDAFLKNNTKAGESEQKVLDRLNKRHHISPDSYQEFETNLTFGQRLADRIAVFGGSWTFIIIFVSVLLAWVILNSLILPHFNYAFDSYPYIFLNLVLSMLTALQAPPIIMLQNRFASKDRVAAKHDYEVNIKLELEIMALHRKIDLPREQQWNELLAMQQEQI